jgi:hypothetical protein
MSIQYRKSIKILPFMRMNLSNSGTSFTFKVGPFSFNTRGRKSVNLPGGYSYRSGR